MQRHSKRHTALRLVTEGLLIKDYKNPDSFTTNLSLLYVSIVFKAGMFSNCEPFLWKKNDRWLKYRSMALKKCSSADKSKFEQYVVWMKKQKGVR